MNILLVNEQGCFAPGIIALGKALSARHRVVIVAPLQPQINSGHKFTMSVAPLRVKQYFILNKIKIFSVNGTPCDCVTLALDKLLHSKPDLIISGIADRNNRGAEHIYSSGIVAAAVEGTVQGIPSIAVSAKVRDADGEEDFVKIANAFTKHLMYFVKNMPPHATLNINYPEKFRPGKIVCAPLTTGVGDNKYQCETNPYGHTFYWIKLSLHGYPLSALEQKGDIYYLKKGYITVTPLKRNLTNLDAFEAIEKAGIVL